MFSSAFQSRIEAVVSRLPEYCFPDDDVRPVQVEPSVLIVDDDPDIPPLVDAALKPFHIRTESATGGVEALKRLRISRFDLVVLDLTMADVHGYDVLRSLRQSSLNRRVPVLVLTGNGSHEAIARSFGQGADEFVRKPFDPKELGLRVFRLICPFED